MKIGWLGSIISDSQCPSSHGSKTTIAVETVRDVAVKMMPQTKTTTPTPKRPLSAIIARLGVANIMVVFVLMW